MDEVLMPPTRKTADARAELTKALLASHTPAAHPAPRLGAGPLDTGRYDEMIRAEQDTVAAALERGDLVTVPYFVLSRALLRTGALDEAKRVNASGHPLYQFEPTGRYEPATTRGGKAP